METKTMVKNNMIKTMEMAEIFKVEGTGTDKHVNRWGFFANQGDGQYAIYRPQKPICNVDEYFMIDEDGPGPIEIVSEASIREFLNEISDSLRGISGAEVSRFTACGWYYDTIV